MCILTWRKDKMRKDPMEFEFGNVDFWGEGKTAEPGEKVKEPTTKLTLNQTRQRRWEASAITTTTLHPRIAVHLLSNRSQKLSKCGKNINDTLGYPLTCHFFVLTTF